MPSESSLTPPSESSRPRPPAPVGGPVDDGRFVRAFDYALVGRRRLACQGLSWLIP
jgi:hypothetical protein